MRPREDDPVLFRRNVRMSWELLHYIVSRVSDECFIGHSGLSSGVGYDCLTLVTRSADGDVKIRMSHNRNGTNSTVLANIWEEIEDRGIEAVAEDLITRTRLVRATSRVSSDAEWVSAQVCAWIAEHEGEEFFVGPHGWPKGCHSVSAEPISDWSLDEWPIDEHGPEVLLGIDRVEVARLVFGQRAKISAETNSTDGGERMNADGVAREFGSLEEALREWAPLAERPGVWPEVDGIVDRAKSVLGEVVRVHVPPSSSYIGLTFSAEPRQIGVHIHSGFVDSIIELAGSYVPEAAPRAWRTNLSTFEGEVSKRKTEGGPSPSLCPSCGLAVGKYAECICGWSPLDA